MKIAVVLCGGVCLGICCFGCIICIMDDNIQRCLSGVAVVVAEVKEILGHEKLDTTMIYAKISHDSVKFNHKRYIV